MFRPMNALTTHFRDAVKTYLERTGTAPARLGLDALGDPSFVHRLMRGREPRLDTADRVLVFMGETPVGPAFRAEVAGFVAVTRTKPYVLGLDAAGDPSFVARLRRGSSPRLDTAERVLRWMAARCTESERGAIRAGLCGEPAGAIVEDRGGDVEVNDRPTEYMGTREAAAFLGLSPRTLDRYRVTGAGPAFHKFGTRIRYARADLEAWAAARRRTSTSDDGGDDGPNDGPRGRRAR